MSSNVPKVEVAAAKAVPAARDYQAELFNLAKDMNCIICLPTGSGKTYIALQLIKHYLPSAIRDKKKIVFVANNVPLVQQQYNYIKSHLPESQKTVQKLTGDMNVDKWDRACWTRLITDRLVFVMSSQILLDILVHAYLKWSDIALIVLDECHHAQKDHPMANIMRRYCEYERQGHVTDPPRVLGLTATIIKGNSSISKIPDEVNAIQSLFRAQAVTYRYYEKVLSCSTNAKVRTATYDLSKTPYKLQSVALNELQMELKNFEMLDPDFFTEEVGFSFKEIRHASLVSKEQLFNKTNKSSLAGLKTSIFGDIEYIYMELGPYCARLAAYVKKMYLYKKIMEYPPMDLDGMALEENISFKNVECAEMDKDMVEGAVLQSMLTHLDRFLAILERDLSSYTIQEQILNFRSDKLMKLCDLLHSRGDKQDLCAVVFCQRRVTAQILNWFFEDAKQYCKKEFGMFRTDFVLGLNRSIDDSLEGRVSMYHQEVTIGKFRSRELNLLFATSVLEEGLDVPSCNIVVRFDSVLSYPSYIQSRGRARDKDAYYFVMIDTEAQTKEVEKLTSYHQFSIGLADYLVKRAVHADDDCYDPLSPYEEKDDDKIPPYAPYGVNGPKIPSTEAITIIHQYCNTLSVDRKVLMVPVSWWSPAANGQFKAHLQMPLNSLVKGIIEGPAYPSKYAAKRAVYLAACELLHKKGGLDDNLLPRAKVEVKIEDVQIPPIEEFTKFAISKDTKKDICTQPGGVKVFFKKVPELYMNIGCIKPEIELVVFQILIRQREHLGSPETATLYKFENFSRSFALLFPCGAAETIKKVPHFLLHSKIGDFIVSIELVSEMSPLKLSLEEYNEVIQFQSSIFEKCFFIHVVMGARDASPLLVVPLIQEEKLKIDWETVAQLNRFKLDSLFTRPTAPFEPHYYEDSVVARFYRPAQEPNFMCVCRVNRELTPTSTFLENPTIPSYEAYFKEKYKLTVTDKSQPLLVCKELGGQLNFLSTKCRDVLKLSKEERKSQRAEDQICVLVPEFSSILPIKASLLAQARFMPSIVHRLGRFLLCLEIRESIALQTGWELSNTDLSKEMDLKLYEEEKQREMLGPLGPNFDSRQQKPDSAFKESKQPRLALKPAGETQEKFFSPTGAEETNEQRLRRIREETYVKELHRRLEYHVDFVHPIKLDINKLNEDLVKRQEFKMSVQPKMDMDPSHLTMTPSPSSLTDEYELDETMYWEECDSSLDAPTDFNFHSGPSLYVLYEALTLANSEEDCSLERLEVIGDSVLKYFVSTHIFVEFPEYSEGQLTQLRNHYVSNNHLELFGNAKCLGEILAGSVFRPRMSWLPPSYKIIDGVSEAAAIMNKPLSFFEDCDISMCDSSDDILKWGREKQHCFPTTERPSFTSFEMTRLKRKNVADCVEAIIGAYFNNGGLDAAAKVLTWFGLRGTTLDRGLVPYKVRRNIKWPEVVTTESPKKLVPFYQSLEEILKYPFRNPWLLVEALTHPCYVNNHVTDCYQRLEFLGDAILDFLVTVHIYKEKAVETSTPGKLTDLRSALVNNVTFGSLAVRYNFHKYFLYLSKELQTSVDTFVNYQKHNNHQVTGHFQLLNDNEVTCAQDVEVPKVLGDIFESIAGAVFVDSGFSLDRTWEVFYRLLKPEIDKFSVEVPKSPVREIYELFPNQISLKDYQAEHDGFGSSLTCVELTVPFAPYNVVGIGRNKTSAKQAAAKCALKKYKSMEKALKSHAPSGVVNVANHDERCQSFTRKREYPWYE